MKTYNAVQTSEKARSIIENYVATNNLIGGNYKNSSSQCECGETSSITWYNGEVYLFVAICEICGDDDTFVNEVLNIKY